jgi:phosphonate transport system permease protein
MLGKLLADTIEEIDSVMLDSMTSVGANKLQVAFYGIFPQILPNLVTYAFFRLEISIRLSVILGAVREVGIGYELEYAFNMLNYHWAMTAFLLILLIVPGTEQVFNLVKKRIKGREVLL